MPDSLITFQKWVLHGNGGMPGWRRIINYKLFVYLTIGICITLLTTSTISKAASSAIFPLIGVLIGLIFGWTGNAQGILRSKSIRLMSKNTKGGIVDYVYAYQLAAFTILLVLCGWSLAAIGVFDWANCFPILSFSTKIILFSGTVLSLHQCWLVVSASQALLLAEFILDDLIDE